MSTPRTMQKPEKPTALLPDAVERAWRHIGVFLQKTQENYTQLLGANTAGAHAGMNPGDVDAVMMASINNNTQIIPAYDPQQENKSNPSILEKAEVVICRCLSIPEGPYKNACLELGQYYAERIMYDFFAKSTNPKLHTIIFPFSSHVHGMNMVAEIYNGNQVRITLVDPLGEACHGSYQELFTRLKAGFEVQGFTVDDLNHAPGHTQEDLCTCAIQQILDARMYAENRASNPSDLIDYKGRQVRTQQDCLTKHLQQFQDAVRTYKIQQPYTLPEPPSQGAINPVHASEENWWSWIAEQEAVNAITYKFDDRVQLRTFEKTDDASTTATLNQQQITIAHNLFLLRLQVLGNSPIPDDNTNAKQALQALQALINRLETFVLTGTEPNQNYVTLSTYLRHGAYLNLPAEYYIQLNALDDKPSAQEITALFNKFYFATSTRQVIFDKNVLPDGNSNLYHTDLLQALQKLQTMYNKNETSINNKAGLQLIVRSAEFLLTEGAGSDTQLDYLTRQINHILKAQNTITTIDTSIQDVLNNLHLMATPEQLKPGANKNVGATLQLTPRSSTQNPTNSSSSSSNSNTSAAGGGGGGGGAAGGAAAGGAAGGGQPPYGGSVSFSRLGTPIPSTPTPTAPKVKEFPQALLYSRVIGWARAYYGLGENNVWYPSPLRFARARTTQTDSHEYMKHLTRFFSALNTNLSDAMLETLENSINDETIYNQSSFEAILGTLTDPAGNQLNPAEIAAFLASVRQFRLEQYSTNAFPWEAATDDKSYSRRSNYGGFGKVSAAELKATIQLMRAFNGTSIEQTDNTNYTIKKNGQDSIKVTCPKGKGAFACKAVSAQYDADVMMTLFFITRQHIQQTGVNQIPIVFGDDFWQNSHLLQLYLCEGHINPTFKDPDGNLLHGPAAVLAFLQKQINTQVSTTDPKDKIDLADQVRFFCEHSNIFKTQVTYNGIAELNTYGEHRLKDPTTGRALNLQQVTDLLHERSNKMDQLRSKLAPATPAPAVTPPLSPSMPASASTGPGPGPGP